MKAKLGKVKKKKAALSVVSVQHSGVMDNYPYNYTASTEVS